MDIHPSDEVRSVPGGGHFTGSAWLDVLIDEPGDDAMRMYRVCFAPGARTNWHRHPGGQALYIVAGQARVGAEGEPAQTVSPGDSVYTPPGQWHWHGATPGAYMVHVAVNPSGKTEWGEDKPVTDEEYEG